tara:strand:- start:132910 stop:133194 length:285 start_codon:yes stop_codon:yes gene_type:complete
MCLYCVQARPIGVAKRIHFVFALARGCRAQGIRCFDPLGVSCMTPFFKVFLMLSITLLGAINVADAFILKQPEQAQLKTERDSSVPADRHARWF